MHSIHAELSLIPYYEIHANRVDMYVDQFSNRNIFPSADGTRAENFPGQSGVEAIPGASEQEVAPGCKADQVPILNVRVNSAPECMGVTNFSIRPLCRAEIPAAFLRGRRGPSKPCAIA